MNTDQTIPDIDEGSKLESSPVAVLAVEGQNLNGLGMMIQQYLEQNFAEFEHKVEAGRRIRGRVCVEVEKGIATTVSFQGEEILIENGSGEHLDLHLQSSYLLLANILSGKANPFVEVMKGNIKLRAFPRKPIQSLKVLSFLKIPPELLIEPPPSKGMTYLLWAAGSIVGLGGLSLLVYYLFQLFGGS
ncbi:MAG: hypothetical protein ACWGSD_00700 [Thermodesulfobacteriota bacterium]